MKPLHWCICLLVTVCCWSCKQSSAEFTPYIQVSYFYLNPVYGEDTISTAQDTLMLHYSDGVYVIDTIDKDDYVAFQAFFGSYSNELTAVRVVHDTAQLDMYAKLSSQVQSVLADGSDVRCIRLNINPGYNGLSFPVIYQPKQSGTFQFSLICESDSKLSPSTVVFRQPVR